MVLILGEMMRKNNKGNLLDGLVVDNDDPQQMGRLKVWVPSLDGDDYNIENLPWTFYLSPIASQTLDFMIARNKCIYLNITCFINNLRSTIIFFEKVGVL